MTREAVIVDALRTPIGRYGGALRAVRPDDLAAVALRALMARNPIDPALVEDVYLGCSNQAGEDNRNVARMALLLAGLPESVAGCTVNRLCGSGLEAVNAAVRAILCGEGEVFVAGGVESMTRAPHVLPKAEAAYARGDRTAYDSTLGWRLVNPEMERLFPPLSLGETAEEVGARWGVGREAQDDWAFESQQRWRRADERGLWAGEVVPVPVPAAGGGPPALFERDEHPRPESTRAQLARLKPVFRAGGTVTAGNSSGLNDGAAALLLMSRRKAADLGLRPLAQVCAMAVAGVHPDVMGMGPVPAGRKALARAGLRVDELEAVELNEAFASQVVACARELGIDERRLNPNGGAIAMGHPLGCSGARLLVTLVRELERRGGGCGMATMCIGVGQGIATVVRGLP